MQPFQHARIIKVNEASGVNTDDILAVEEPLEILLTYQADSGLVSKCISVTMRTPGNDEELAAGFLFTEAIINNKQQIKQIISTGENKVCVTFNPAEVPNLNNAERNFYTSSSCGVCGKSSIEAIKTVSIFEVKKDNTCLLPEVIYNLHETLLSQQSLFETTGGLHASAIFDLQGNHLCTKEDVGRHNALDKIIGNAFLHDNLPLDKCILLLSGRASFELVQKALMAGIRIIVAVGAPSSLAVQLACESGITLIGFLRNRRFNIYSGKERILFGK